MKDDFHQCTCIERNHDHPFKDCDRQPVIRGGVCRDCIIFRQGNPPKKGLRS